MAVSGPSSPDVVLGTGFPVRRRQRPRERRSRFLCGFKGLSHSTPSDTGAMPQIIHPQILRKSQIQKGAKPKRASVVRYWRAHLLQIVEQSGDSFLSCAAAPRGRT